MRGKFAQGGFKGESSFHPQRRPVEMRSTKSKESDLKEERKQRTIAKITKIETAKMKERDLRRIAEIRAGWSPRKSNNEPVAFGNLQHGSPEAIESPNRTVVADREIKTMHRYRGRTARTKNTPRYKTQYRANNDPFEKARDAEDKYNQLFEARE